MKKFALLSTAILMALFSFAQNKSHQTEAGIVFSSLNSFGLAVKTGTDKGLWRFTALSLSGLKDVSNSDSVDIKNVNLGFQVKVGREWRTKITKTFEFRYGLDLSFSYSHSKNVRDDKSVNQSYGGGTVKSDSYIPGVNLVLGFNYVFEKVIVLGFEAMPFFNYTTGSSTDEYPKNKISNFSYGISSSSLLLSISYRFGHKKTSN